MRKVARRGLIPLVIVASLAGCASQSPYVSEVRSSLNVPASVTDDQLEQARTTICDAVSEGTSTGDMGTYLDAVGNFAEPFDDEGKVLDVAQHHCDD
ncbi:hypothetical protein [Herbiconiux solani]|uniref:hypothetical protein n=1 Tax=Herbiconiux solani TaxID=661329 RepID=UPI0012EE21B9|nr:hypothetical protein [Herbiconiux solani]